MYRRIWMAVLTLAFAGALAACGSSSSQPAAAPTAAPAAEAPAAPAAAEPTGAPAAEAPTAAPATDSPTAAPAADAAGGTRTFAIVPEQTEASYEVQEKFLSRDLPNMAIGKTNVVSGDLQVSTDGKPTGKITKITVDLRTLTSDSSRRDGRIRTQWLESDKYPFAEFTSTNVEGTPETYTEGQEVNLKLTGDMKIREVTKPVTFDVKGKLEGDTITGSATSKILMKDFGFDPPSIAGMLTVEDGVTITINFTAKEVK
ncbi:MAG TPA: YceI family protein [Roseiflexaceae bacterium]|nr:YceI family protein [Roseiflexaceae bacterium]